jgi:nitroreductase
VDAILCRSLVKVPGKNKANTEVEMEVFEAIKTRRSIRHYKSEAIAEEKLNAVLEAARWAPSWRNTQCWRFIVVRDAEIKRKLSETLLYYRPGENPSTSAVRDAPVVIAACGELKKSGYYEKIPNPLTDKGDWWYMFDVALATQNVMLAAHSLGLGTVTVGLFDAPRAAQILKLPANIAVVVLLPLGYPDEEPELHPRKELSEIAFRDRYGQK